MLTIYRDRIILSDVAIPTGIPIVYKFDKMLNPIPPSANNQTASQLHMNGLFLEKPGLLKEALAREAQWAQQVPGYNSTLGGEKNPLSAMERSLYKLQAERELGEWAGQFIGKIGFVYFSVLRLEWRVSYLKTPFQFAYARCRPQQNDRRRK